MVHYEEINGEIHIKIGGDHGDKSFKIEYQICNRENPNSKENTVVFCTFEAKDKKINLKTALLQFRDEITDLQRSVWRDRRIRLFMFGDYDFFGEMYGTSGSSGNFIYLFQIRTLI